MIFLYGTLRHPPLLRAVLGRAVETAPAHLPGGRVVHAPGASWPRLLLPRDGQGGAALGILIDADATDRARLDFYEQGFGYELAPLAVETGDGSVRAEAYLPLADDSAPGPDWTLDDWVRSQGALALETAGEFMDLWPGTSAETAAARWPQILQRAASRLRAAADPVARGIRQGRGPVEVLSRRTPWRGFFELVEARLRFPRFDGSPGPVVQRAAFVSGDAVTVLPYDPVRDRVLVVEQFRFAPLVRGDALPWSVEAIAGRIDGGETPEDAARREALEETGLNLGRLIAAGRYYPSPGAVTEYLYSYIAPCDLPDGSAGLGGLADEAEDIRAHLLDFDALMEMVARGGIENAPLLVSALQLARLRADLRAGGAGQAG